VRATRIGIAPEHLPRIFDRFYRVDKSRSRRDGGGSGIGLTIARALIEAHGGHIWVVSPGEARGSVFSFPLPIAR
jgi:two-component system sensor histidine kinase BaeS